MQKKKLLLHFGIHRTGSTSIQRAFDKSRGILRSHGIKYPRLFNKNDHINIPWMLKNGRITSEELCQELLRCIEPSDKIVVVSAEDFCLLDDFSFIQELSKYFNVSIYIYLKEQFSWLESWYNQHIKWPWDRSLSSATPAFFLENIEKFHWINYNYLLNNILEYISLDSLNVRVVDEVGVINTLEDLCNVLGIKIDWLNNHSSSNESLSSAKISILRSIDIFGLSPVAKNKIIQVVNAINIEEDNGSKRIFKHEDYNKIKMRFKDSNKIVAQSFFNREELFSVKEYNGSPNIIPQDKIERHYLPLIIKKVADL